MVPFLHSSMVPFLHSSDGTGLLGLISVVLINKFNKLQVHLSTLHSHFDKSHAVEEVRLNNKRFMHMQIVCIAFCNRHSLTRTLYKLTLELYTP